MSDTPLPAPNRNVNKSVIRRHSWEEFRSTGLLWFINRTLHLFGWAIAVETETAEDGAKILNVYPVRTLYRGFDQDAEKDGYTKLTAYMAENAQELMAEVNKG